MRLIFQSDPLGVRDALEDIMTGLGVFNIQQDDCATIEIVLAEALNNIVEHAYGEGGAGPIEVWIGKSAAGLHCSITDQGVEMKGQKMPTVRAHNLDCAIDDLPEGGFGWSLIRNLTKDLSYERQENRNLLDFWFVLGTEP